MVIKLKKGVHFFGLSIIALITMITSNAIAQRVGIFDYDDRNPFPDALSKHIELRLMALKKGVLVDHYSGRKNERRSVRILTSMEKMAYDLIIVRTSDALILAQHTLFNTKVLYTNVNNPEIYGFRTLGPPGGNISGVSYYTPIKVHLAVYRKLQPSLKKIGFIFDRNNKSRKAEVPEARNACRNLGLVFFLEFIERKKDLHQAVNALIDQGVDGIVASTSDLIYNHIDHILPITEKEKIPVYSLYTKGVYKGAVAGMNGNYFQMVDSYLIPMAQKVLIHGYSPGELPAAFLRENTVIINAGKALKFGIRIPDEVIIKEARISVEAIHP